MDEFLFIVFICLAVGLFLIIGAIYLFICSKETLNWIPVKGRMLNISLEKVVSDNLDTVRITYKTGALYSYCFDNKEYKSRRIYYGDFISTNYSRKYKKIINRYAKDSEIVVFCNPANPKESVIKQGIDSIIYKVLILGIVLIVLVPVIYIFH